jgi:hypothetical protein
MKKIAIFAVMCLVLIMFIELALISHRIDSTNLFVNTISLQGHRSADIPVIMKSVGGRYGGIYESKKNLERDLIWFQPVPHIEFRGKTYYYRIGSKFGIGSVLIYVDERDIVYAVHFLEDAVPSAHEHTKQYNDNR